MTAATSILILVLAALLPGERPPVAPAFAAPPAQESPPRPNRPNTNVPISPAAELKNCLNLIRAKQYDAARERLAPLIAAHPQWPRAKFMLALTYHEEQRYELAKPLFAETLELDAREHTVRPFYGWCLYYLGEPEGAREQFDAYLKIKPDYADAHFAIGLIEFDEDHMDAAVDRFNKTIEISKASRDPRTEGKARARLGDVYMRQNHLDKARDELEKAVELRTDAYEAYYKLSRVYQRLGNVEKAKWAREMHEKVREEMHPTTPTEGGATSRPAPRTP